jgi:cytoskeletal protein RodZ
MHEDPTRMMRQPDGQQPRGNMRLLVAGLIAVIVGLLVAILVIANDDGGSGTTPTSAVTTLPTESSTTETTTGSTTETTETTSTEPTTTESTATTTSEPTTTTTPPTEEENGSGGIGAP